MRRAIATFLSVAALVGCQPPPPASLVPEAVSSPDTTDLIRGATTRTRRFYGARRYGSEAQFNPLSVLINEGFDQVRTSANHRLFDRSYGAAATTVWRSIVHPDRVVRRYGVGNWVRNEVFPLSLKGDGGGQWYPNYHLHLWASGMTYARLAEWFEAHGFESHPRVAAGATAYAFHFLNEVIENGDSRVDNADAMTDLLIFDAASIALWNQAWMQRLFSGGVEMTNWNGQPSLGIDGTTIENAFAMTMLRVPLPRSENWKGMMTVGSAFLVGLSRRASGDRWISASVGFDPSDNPVLDPATGRKTVTLRPNAGLFFDREGSLLLSLITKAGSDNGATLNVYPGALRIRGRSPSLWIQHVRSGGVRLGLTSPLGIGVSTHAR